MKKLLSLLLVITVFVACKPDDPAPSGSTPLDFGIPVELDSVTHTNGGTTWRTYFNFDIEGRLSLITGSGSHRNYRREFQY